MDRLTIKTGGAKKLPFKEIKFGTVKDTFSIFFA
jgi:hypothetical protein